MEGGRGTRTVTPWGTKESGAGAIHGYARASGDDTGKAPSVAADKAGVWDRHGARQP